MPADDFKGLVILGTGDFALLVHDVAVESGVRVVGFTSDADEAPKMADGLPPYVARADLLDVFPPGEFGVFVGFIGKGLMRHRSERFEEMRALGYSLPNVIQPGACVSGSLGVGNLLMAGCCVGPRCSIGNGNILWQNCVLAHDNTVGNFNNISPTASFSGYARVGNHTLIGNGSVLNNFAAVGDWALVGAGSYVRKEVPPQAVLVPPQSYLLEGKKGLNSYDSGLEGV